MRYSQHGEDEYLSDYIFKNKIEINKLFVDIGAGDGLFLSNSRFFIESGWKAILVEPNRNVFIQLLENSKHYPVACFNYGISEKIGKRYLQEDGHYTQHTVTDSVTAHEIECVTFEDLNIAEQIGILSIDTEGYDIEVLNQCLEICKPTIIIIEGNTQELRDTEAEILLRNGYKLINTFDVNTIWIYETL